MLSFIDCKPKKHILILQLDCVLFEEQTYSSLIDHCNNAMVKQVRGNGVFSRLRSDDEAELGNDSFELLQNGLDFVEEWNVVVDVRKHHPLTLKFHKKNNAAAA